LHCIACWRGKIYLCLLGSDLLDGSQEGFWVRADDLVDLLALVEDDECGHGADVELLSYVWDVVDVQLDEVGAGELVGELVNLWGDDLARSTPGCETVEDDDVVVGESIVKLCLRGDIVDTHSCGC